MHAVWAHCAAGTLLWARPWHRPWAGRRRPPPTDLSPAWPNCLPCPAQRDPLERAERPLLRLVRQWCGTPWAGGNPSGSGAPEPVFACLGSPVRTAAVGAAAGTAWPRAVLPRLFFALGEHAQPSPRVDQPLHPTAPGLEALSRAGASRSGVQHMAALIGGREPAPNWISWHSQADAELRGTIIRQVVSGRADQWGESTERRRQASPSRQLTQWRLVGRSAGRGGARRRA